MEQSNLRLFSNIYPWKGRWREGNQEFVSRIWDDRALGVLKIAERKKEVQLSSYQEELYNCTIQCPHLPKGERPWGWIAAGQISCLCRSVHCDKFAECRGSSGPISEREREIWTGGDQSGLKAFEITWNNNRMYVDQKRDTGSVDLFRVFADGEYDSSNALPERPYDPNIATGYPDDEEYE